MLDHLQIVTFDVGAGGTFLWIFNLWKWFHLYSPWTYLVILRLWS